MHQAKVEFCLLNAFMIFTLDVESEVVEETASDGTVEWMKDSPHQFRLFQCGANQFRYRSVNF